MFILITGILSVVTCSLLGPIAIAMNSNYRREAIIEDIEPDPMASVGGILGYAGTALMLLQIVGLLLFFALGLVSTLA